MQLKNDYNKEVFNGDLGIVRAIDKMEKEITIDFDGRDVVYDYADLNEINLILILINFSFGVIQI